LQRTVAAQATLAGLTDATLPTWLECYVHLYLTFSSPITAWKFSPGVVLACVGALSVDAGWSSLVARRAHNPKSATRG
jgi:hypothetical protein